MIAAGITAPDVVVFAYGMNDSAPAQFNANQTYNTGASSNFIVKMRENILRAKAAGADVMIYTTPHASVVNYASTMYQLASNVPMIYPTSVAAPVAPEQLLPPASQSNVTADFLGNGTPITVGHRFLRVNQAMRSLAAELGCVLLDAERYWFEAIQAYQISTGSASGAENSLFNSGEYVHPNLLGHQHSYWTAAADFCSALNMQGVQCTQGQLAYGNLGVNVPAGTYAPAAALDVSPMYGDMTTKPLSVKAATGTADGAGNKALVEVISVDASTGDVTTGKFKFANLSGNGVVETVTVNGSTGSKAKGVVSNIAAGATTTITLPDNGGGRLTIRAQQGGVALNQVYDNLFATKGGTATLGTATQIGAGTEFTVAVSGLVVTLTITYANTNIYWSWESW